MGIQDRQGHFEGAGDVLLVHDVTRTEVSVRRSGEPSAGSVFALQGDPNRFIHKEAELG